MEELEDEIARRIYLDQNLCNSCAYDEDTPNNFPCCRCIKWVDGYMEFTMYRNKWLEGNDD